MSIERLEEPAVLQALEQVQEALRTEQRVQEALSRENVRLRTRVEQLQAEREQLLRAVDAREDERSPSAPRLPEVLALPFVLQPHASRRQLFRRSVFAPLFVLLMLAVAWNQDPRARVFNFGLLLLTVAYQGVKLWWGKWWGRWRFDTHGFERGGWPGPQRLVRYSDVLDVEVYVSASQRRRGLGTLVVSYREWPGSPGHLCVQLRDVPEPERLAAWLLAKRSGPA